MKPRPRIIPHIACALLSLTLAACSGGSEENNTQDNSSDNNAATNNSTDNSTENNTANNVGNNTANNTGNNAANNAANRATNNTANSAGNNTSGNNAANSTSNNTTTNNSTGNNTGNTGNSSNNDLPGPQAELVVANQVLASPYEGVEIEAASLPDEPGVLVVDYESGDRAGERAGELAIAQGDMLEGVTVALDERLVGAQTLSAKLLDASDQPVISITGEPIEVHFDVIGDTEEPELAVNSQELDPSNLYELTLDRVVIPERYEVGAWVVIYEDDDGSIGSRRGKVQLQPGAHDGVVFDVNNEFERAQKLHAVIREGRPGSGSFSSSSPVLTNSAGQPMATEFTINAEPFRPKLFVDDQEIVTSNLGNSSLQIASATIPEEHIGGGWVAIYDYNSGARGALLGKLYYTRGTRDDRELELDTPLQGEHTLQAMLHAGQRWSDAVNQPMLDENGDEVAVAFRAGGQDLSYILSPPHTTNHPGNLKIERAYSFDGPAWVEIARDNNGSPGTVIARRRVAKRFAGNVYFDSALGDFLSSGTREEFLRGDPGTYRRSVRGDENLHVLFYKDDPADNQFNYTPGGAEDQPILDASGQPITTRFQVTVEASIQNSQKDSPRYFLPCPLSQHVGNPTALPVDCRCHVNFSTLDFPECKGLIADYLGLSYGAGPRAKTHNFGRWRSGFPEPSSNTLVGLLVWKDAATVRPENGVTIDVGAVVRINPETRDRVIVSGRYEDPQSGIMEVGTGPVLSYPFEIQPGPDGNYYVASYGYVRLGASLTPTVDIIKVDPATGDRSYVWRSNHLGYNLSNEPNPYGHCANGRSEMYGYKSVQIGRKAFGVGPDGSFYLSHYHNSTGRYSDGIGIIKVSADGSSCDFVTRTGVGEDNFLYQGNSIGQGPEPQAGPYKGMLVRNGALYTSTGLRDDLYKIDIATGDRTLLHAYGVDDNNTGSSGTHVVWDPYRDLIWQGGLSSSVLLYDEATDTSEPLWCPENYRNYKGISCMRLGAWGNNGLPLERGFWMHPSDKDYMFVVNGKMIQRAHLPSGTSEIFSY